MGKATSEVAFAKDCVTAEPTPPGLHSRAVKSSAATSSESPVAATETTDRVHTEPVVLTNGGGIALSCAFVKLPTDMVTTDSGCCRIKSSVIMAASSFSAFLESCTAAVVSGTTALAASAMLAQPETTELGAFAAGTAGGAASLLASLELADGLAITSWVKVE